MEVPSFPLFRFSLVEEASLFLADDDIYRVVLQIVVSFLLQLERYLRFIKAFLNLNLRLSVFHNF